MSLLHVILLAIIEGLTEFLPVSSTGHIILGVHALGIEMNEFTKTFTIAIQFGAILAVVLEYHKKFFQSISFYTLLFIAFVPAAVVGFLLHDWIDAWLENVWVIALSLIIGGIVLVFVDRWMKPTQESLPTSKQAFWIGCFQLLALIPGVSRSASTIVGGMVQNLSKKSAAEFSFFLAVPTIFAASAYKLLRFFLQHHAFSSNEIQLLVVGNVVSFIVALLAIRTFIKWLNVYGFAVFGYYRIALGSVIIILLLLGKSLQVV